MKSIFTLGFLLLFLASLTQAQTPYFGTPVDITTKIEAENFDNGANGTAYQDEDNINDGGAYRTTAGMGVDISSCSDDGGGYQIGWFRNTEWLIYTVNVPATGNYNATIRVATDTDGKQIKIYFDGAEKGTFSINSTGGFGSWTDYTINNISLTAGTRKLKIGIPAGSQYDDVDFNWIRFTQVGSVPVTGVTVNPTSTTVAVGSTAQLTATVAPANATNKSVSWASNNTSVATVNASGLVTGVAAGTATITVTTVDGNKQASCSVTVSSVSVPVTGVTLNPTSTTVAIGSTAQLTATVAPANATNKSVSWTSNNTSVATVNSTGLVTGKVSGNASITATTVDGNFSSSTNITVSTSGNPPVFSANLTVMQVTPSNVKLQWGDADTENSYSFQHTTDSNWATFQSRTIFPGITSCGIGDLTPNTTYYFRVEARNSYGSTFSNIVSLTIPDLNSVPPVPDNFNFTVTCTSAELTWTDNSLLEEDFKIERKSGISGDYSEIYRTGANVEKYTNTGLTPNTTYYYRMRASNSLGYSDYTSEILVKTPVCIGGDNLGNHIATKDIQLNGRKLTNNGGQNGIKLNDEGHIGINTEPKEESLIYAITQNKIGISLKDELYRWDISTKDRGYGLSFKNNTGAGISFNFTNMGLGIGTTPQAPLDIYAPASSTGIFIRAGDTEPFLAINKNYIKSYRAESGLIYNSPLLINPGGDVYLGKSYDGSKGMLNVMNSGVGIGIDPGTDAILTVNGNTIFKPLSGVGTRMVVVDASGMISTLAIPGSGGSLLDNMGDHSATRNIKLNNYYISNDGESEGIRVSGDGNVTLSKDVNIYGKQFTAGDLAIQGNVLFEKDLEVRGSLICKSLTGSGTRELVVDHLGKISARDFSTEEWQRWDSNLCYLGHGNIIIGKPTQTTTGIKYKLEVEGIIRAKEIIVNTTGADFVFEPTYKLRSLSELEAFIKANRHLPGIDPARKMQENGVSVSGMQVKLLQKVEEMSLYLIELKKENIAKDNQLSDQQKTLNHLILEIENLKSKLKENNHENE